VKLNLNTVINDINDKPIMVDKETEATAKFFLLQAIDVIQEKDKAMGHIEKCKLYGLLKKIKKAGETVDLKPEEATALKERMGVFSVPVAGAVCELLDG